MSTEKAQFNSIKTLARRTKEAAAVAAQLSDTVKRDILREVAVRLGAAKNTLEAANRRDIEVAERNGLKGPMLERLRLSDKTLDAMIASLDEVADLPDPVGEIENMIRRPNGLAVGRMRIPLGVIGIIYESRPNVTSDAAGLCLKSGNACILRGGSEAIHSNRAVGEVFAEVLKARDLPPEIVTVVPTPDRDTLLEMLKLEESIDLIIPRGGEGLIRFVAENSRIPVIKHYKGICHTFIDAGANVGKAVEIAVNAKAQRPGVCNATETLLVHRDAVASCLVPVAEGLIAAGVELRVCPRTLDALKGTELPESRIKPAAPEDFGFEFLDLILAVRIVDSFEDAVAHIRAFGSEHTESIITEDYGRAMRFLREVNSSVVVVNASTRFADGHQLGLGAEIGISTTKLHAFGPMGIKELTTLKFVVLGDGQIRT